jgi:hypothetical protein
MRFLSVAFELCARRSHRAGAHPGRPPQGTSGKVYKSKGTTANRPRRAHVCLFCGVLVSCSRLAGPCLLRMLFVTRSEIVEEEFLKEVTGSELVVCHFYHNDFERCKIMDMVRLLCHSPATHTHHRHALPCIRFELRLCNAAALAQAGSQVPKNQVH